MMGSAALTAVVAPSLLSCAEMATIAGVTPSGASAAAMSQRSASPSAAESEVSCVPMATLVRVGAEDCGGGGGEGGIEVKV